MLCHLVGSGLAPRRHALEKTKKKKKVMTPFLIRLALALSFVPIQWTFGVTTCTESRDVDCFNVTLNDTGAIFCQGYQSCIGSTIYTDGSILPTGAVYGYKAKIFETGSNFDYLGYSYLSSALATKLKGSTILAHGEILNNKL